MSAGLADVQRIVLRGTPWQAARHLLIDFCGKSPLRALNLLLQHLPPASAGAAANPRVQISLGLTRRGLEHAWVPDHVLASLALKAPAFWSGAALRAASQLGMAGRNAPTNWEPHFAYGAVDAVLSLHADDTKALRRILVEIKSEARTAGLRLVALPAAAALKAPAGMADKGGARPQWVHFGFLDGLSRVGIKGRPSESAQAGSDPSSRHEAGEFVLGHLQDSGANPWVSGPGLRVWPEEVRELFHNGSFGVLQQIQQEVRAFEDYVADKAKASGLDVRELKGKLCGRYPDGLPLAAPDAKDPRADFGYVADPDGMRCPFGSHIRRMNPRRHRLADGPAPQGPALGHDEDLAHFSRSRALLRRGMPYGPAWARGATGSEPERGLIGQFFCASIEDQYEHLLGQWAERVPMGSADAGGRMRTGFLPLPASWI